MNYYENKGEEFVKINLDTWQALTKEIRELKAVLTPESEIIVSAYNGSSSGYAYFNLTKGEFELQVVKMNENLIRLLEEKKNVFELKELGLKNKWKQKSLWDRVFKK